MPDVTGITSYGTYLPHHRLAHEDIGAALGAGGGGSAARVVAAYDEDATTLGVEAARRALVGAPAPAALFFATTSPPYLDKTNATAIHAALNLGHDGFAADVGGAPRSAIAALRAAAGADGGGLAVLADLRTGRPGSADERGSADGAAALAFGSDAAVAATLLGSASSTAEFLDRWRAPGEQASGQWEERFGEAAYRPLVRDAVARALHNAGLEEPDHVVVSSPHARTAATTRRAVTGRAPAPALVLGDAGAADAGLRLADALDRAAPGETILLVAAADGCDALVLRTTDALPGARPATTVRAQLDSAGRALGYATYLTWRGLLDREPPRRPEPDRPAAPAAQRAEAWKFGFVGSACESCGQIHVPPRRVCIHCGAVDRMRPRPMAGVRGRVVATAVDRQAYSPAPPLTTAVIDFDGGGRYTLELADAEPGAVAAGTPVALTFRRLYTVGGVHNYFWKARPTTEQES
jgi:hydroxymethylglutaryl-CoA synthase